MVIAQFPNGAGGRSYDQAARRKNLAFGHQRAGADDALFANHGAIQDSRAHSDQGFVMDRAAMQDRLVPNRNAGADGERETSVAMSHGAVLKIAFLAQSDRCVIRSDHGAEPDACARAKPHVPNQVGGWRNPCPLAKGG